MEQPNYYAILTAEVRYSTKLKPNEKLMYAEITALAQKDGSCWASNTYFADLYDVSVETVSRWISNLVKEGYVTRQIKYVEGTKQIERRYLKVTSTPIDEKVNTPRRNNQYPIDEKINTPIDEKVKGNNTSINTTRLKINKKLAEFKPNQTSFNAVLNQYPNIEKYEYQALINDFIDQATNREKPLKDFDAGFRNYLKRGWISPYTETKQASHSERAKQLVQAEEPNPFMLLEG